MGKHKPYEHPLSNELALEILNIPVEADTAAPPRTIGERLVRAKAAIDEANLHLATSPVAKIVAKSIMQDLKKRGDASIHVRYDGTVVLRITYAEADADAVLQPRRDVPSLQSTHRSDLPYLDDLRKRAARMGVDITHLGRQRRAIWDHLNSIEPEKLSRKTFLDLVEEGQETRRAFDKATAPMRSLTAEDLQRRCR
jgi:hypothetical protein